MEEGSRFLEGQGRVHKALRKICQRLGELNIPYAVIGGMALFQHGLRRFTEDVDILVTPEGLRTIHQELEGRGYLPPFERSKHLRDVELKVKIEFLTSGDFPGDGKPKPVAFPDPASLTINMDGIQVLNLPRLIELKLASGMSGRDRLKDLADVQELIKTLGLTRDLGEELSEYVRNRYWQLFDEVSGVQRRYVMIWPHPGMQLQVKSIADLIMFTPEPTDLLLWMAADGVVVDLSRPTSPDYSRLVTTDPTIAEKYEMHDETEYLDEN